MKRYIVIKDAVLLTKSGDGLLLPINNSKAHRKAGVAIVGNRHNVYVSFRKGGQKHDVDVIEIAPNVFVMATKVMESSKFQNLTGSEDKFDQFEFSNVGGLGGAPTGDSQDAAAALIRTATEEYDKSPYKPDITLQQYLDFKSQWHIESQKDPLKAGDWDSYIKKKVNILKAEGIGKSILDAFGNYLASQNKQGTTTTTTTSTTPPSVTGNAGTGKSNSPAAKNSIDDSKMWLGMPKWVAVTMISLLSAGALTGIGYGIYSVAKAGTNK